MIDPFVDDDGFDIADDLLAALDARDAQNAAARRPPLLNLYHLPATEKRLLSLPSPAQRPNRPTPASEELASVSSTDCGTMVTMTVTQRTRMPPFDRHKSKHRTKSKHTQTVWQQPQEPRPAQIDTAPKKKVSRQQQRKDRKAAEVAEMRRRLKRK